MARKREAAAPPSARERALALREEARALPERGALGARHRVWKTLASLAPEELSRRDVAKAAGELLARLAPFLGDAASLARAVAIVSRWPGALAKRFFALLESAAGEEGRDDEARIRLYYVKSTAKTAALVREALGGDASLALETLAALLAGGEWPDAEWAEGVRRVASKSGAAAFRELTSRLLALEVGPPEALSTILAARVIWTAGLFAKTGETLRSLAKTAELDARRGKSSAPVALAVVRALSLAPAELALPELSRLAVRLRHKPTLRAIEKAQEAHAKAAGTTRDELTEASVPTHGLDADGRHWLGGFRLAVTAGEVVVEPLATGLRAPPTSVKRLANAIEETLRVERARFESAMIDERTWSLDAFRQIVAHPILRSIAARLAWLGRAPGATRATWVFVAGGDLVDLHSQPFEDPPVELLLAHPIIVPEDELELARQRFAHTARQPFRQLFRETYAAAPHEREALRTARFAGQVVPQATLYALAKGRGWSGFSGFHESGWEGSRVFARHGFRAHLQVGDASRGEERLMRLGELCFERKEGRSWVTVPLGEVPRLVFSEACRDVDLVQGVTAIGEMLERDADRLSLHEYEFSAFDHTAQSAEVRAKAIEQLIPSLGLAGRVTIRGRYAHVRGELGRYRVHLGSASVFREPAGRQIAFPRSATELAPRVHLPGKRVRDLRVEEIVARILLLAGDALVSDPDLAAQLGGSS